MHNDANRTSSNAHQAVYQTPPHLSHIDYDTLAAHMKHTCDRCPACTHHGPPVTLPDGKTCPPARDTRPSHSAAASCVMVHLHRKPRDRQGRGSIWACRVHAAGCTARVLAQCAGGGIRMHVQGAGPMGRCSYRPWALLGEHVAKQRSGHTPSNANKQIRMRSGSGRKEEHNGCQTKGKLVNTPNAI